MYVVYRWLLAYFKDGVGNSVRVRVKSIFFKSFCIKFLNIQTSFKTLNDLKKKEKIPWSLAATGL